MAEQANYQGEHLGLTLNRDAVFALNDALEQLRHSVRDQTSAAVPLRLPDGRTLQLRVSLTDAGEIRDANGDYLDDDGVAHGDVTGDLAAHADVRQVLDHVVRPSLMWDLSTDQREGSEPVDVDALATTRAEAALETLPFRYGRSQEWATQLRDRALNFAREELPALLEEDRESLLRGRAARGDTPILTGPSVAPAAAVAAEAAEDRYAYRGSTVGGGELVERLIADGLASPAARDSDVDEVVWQVVEVNAVDFDEPVDAHDFPRKLSAPVSDPRAPSGLSGAVSRPEPSAAVDDAGPVLKPPARLRNYYDDIRQGSSASARTSTERAAADTARGDDASAAERDDWAGNQRDHASWARSRAVELDREAQAEDPAGYAQRLAQARTVDPGDHAAMLADHLDGSGADLDEVGATAADRVDADGPHSPRRDPTAGERSLPVEGSQPPALHAPARPRNRFDDDRRAETDQASERRGWAAQATADGRHSHASYWTAQAQRLDEYAGQSRRAAIAEADTGHTAGVDPSVPRRAEAGAAPEPVAAAVERVDAELPQLQAPARPRNEFDDDRRRMTDNARFTREVAQHRAQLGDTTWAARWAEAADAYDHAALGYRRLAITEPAHSARRADAAELHADHARDTSRTAGSDGHAGGAGMSM